MTEPSARTPAPPRAAELFAVAVVLALAASIHWPGLAMGLMADDYLQRAMLDGHYPIRRAPWDLYSFYGGATELPALVKDGVLPWWIPPELRLTLLRPLPSLSLWLDRNVLELSLRAMHAHSLAWMLAFLAAFHLLARRLLPVAAAVLATALMAFDVSVVSSAAWLCNRATAVSGTFALLGLAAYHARFDGAGRRSAVVATLCFAVAFLGGEYAICALTFVLCHELIAAQDSLRARLERAAVALGPASVYAVAYVAGRYGAGGGTVYISPLEDPLAFAGAALSRVPSLLATDLLLLPGEAVYVAATTRSPLLVWALVPLGLLVALLGALLSRLDSANRRRFSAYGAAVVASVVPLSGTVPGVRLLLVPSVASSLVLAAAFMGVFAQLRDRARRRGPLTWILSMAAFPVAALHLVVSPLVAHQQSRGYRDEAARLRQASYDSEIDDSRVASQDLVLLNQPADLVAVSYTVLVRHDRGSPRPRSFRTLSSALVPLTVRRTADDTLELRATNEGDAFFNYDAAREEAPKRPFHVGQRFDVPGVEIEILEVRGWAPSRVRYRFPTRVDDPSRVLLRFEHGRLVRFPAPAVGHEAAVAVGWP
jgi:hypothetical protein